MGEQRRHVVGWRAAGVRGGKGGGEERAEGMGAAGLSENRASVGGEPRMATPAPGTLHVRQAPPGLLGGSG